VRLARPLFLYGGFAGFALGAAVARSEHVRIDIASYVAGQSLVTAFQLMVHFANDYFDRAPDALTVRTRVSGGSGALVDGSLRPQTALVAALVCAAIGCLGVLHAALTGATAVACLGTAIGVLAWSYSAPPMRFCARGLGEVDTVAVVAVLVPLLGFASFGAAIDPRAFAVTIPGAIAMFAMMLSVEIPDIAADAATAKRTLVVRWGTARAKTIIRWCASVLLFGFCALSIYEAHNTRISALAAFVAAGVAAIVASRRSSVPHAATLTVALYATTVTTVATFYVVSGAAR